jgi:RNA polymerase sigma factor (sigma-70 family)
MSQATLGELVRYLRTACDDRLARDLTDGELLERFLTGREEAAFALLVQRHGPMVQAVCRRVLGDSPGAEDCFQATFLVLVRRAGSIREKGSVGSWLYAVASRIATKARAQAAARRHRERQAANMPRAEPLDELTWQELRSVLDEEVGRLPEKYRAPLVLCYFEGKSYEQAARELGWPKSSLAQRLARARQLLHGSLARRGVTLSAGALAVALGERVAAAPVSALLTLNTVRAAARVLAGKAAPAACVSRQALTLAEEAMKPMPGVQTKLGVLLLAAGLALGGAWTALGALAEKAPEQQARALPARSGIPGPGKKDAAVPVDRFGDALPEGAVARLGTVRYRHGYNTFGLAFAPGGKALASAGVGGVCIWDLATGRPLQRLPVPHLVRALAYSPDGKWLVTAGHEVRLLEAATGKEVRRLQTTRGLSLDVVAFSSDGRTVATGETRGARAFGDKGAALILWDATTGKVLHRLKGHEDVTAVAFSRDGKTVASGSADKQVRLWDVASGKPLHGLEGHEGAVHALAFAPGGKVLASAGEDRVVRLWDVTTGKPLRPLKGHAQGLFGVVFSPDGKVLACRGRDGIIHLWEPDTGREIRRWDAGGGFVGELAFSPDGKVLASASASTIRLWDPARGKEISPETGHTAPLRLLRFAPDGKTLFSCAMDRKVLAWDLDTGRERLLGAQSESSAAALSPDGKVLAQSRFGDKFIRLLDVVTGKEQLALEASPRHTPVLAFSPDGKLLASNSYDGTRLWDLTTGKVLRHLKENHFSPSALAFSPDGKLLAFACDDKTIRLWEVPSGKEVRRWERTEDFIRILAFSPDGKSLLSYGNPGSDLRVWATATGKQLWQFNKFQRILGLAISPSGRTLAAVDLVRDNFPGPDETQVCTLHLLEVPTGQEIRRINMPQESGWAVAFAPDGRTLATGGDSTVLIWDLTGRARVGKSKVAPLTTADLDRLWSELAGDAATADRALGTLALGPRQSVPFFGERLLPVAAPAERVAKLLADLDSKSFTVRDKAARALERLGESAEAAVRKALEGKHALEVRQRLEQILERRAKDALRPLRVIDALERVGTPEARGVLTQLAERSPNPQVAFAARAALRRLSR